MRVRVSVLIISCLLFVLLVTTFLLLDRGPSDLAGTDLRYLEQGAVSAHVEALKSPDPSARSKAATLFWQMGGEAKEATPALLQAAKDPNPQVREAAVKALGRTGQGAQDGIPGLIEALKDNDVEVRATAATSLAETLRSLGRSRRSAAGRTPSSRNNPADGRGEGPSNPTQDRPPTQAAPPYAALAQKAVPLLTAALRDADARLRAAAAEALVETGPLAEPAVPDLVQILQKDADSNARLQATLALGSIGPGAKAAVPVLVDKLRAEKVDGVRVNTAAVLGMIRSSPETVLPALVETLLNDKHSDARNCAMMSIGQFGPDAKLALPLLRVAAKDLKNQDPNNRESSATVQRINRLLSFIEKQAQGSEKDRAGAASPASPGPRSK